MAEDGAACSRAAPAEGDDWGEGIPSNDTPVLLDLTLADLVEQAGQQRCGVPVEVHGRKVALFAADGGSLHCVDELCFHTGGPLHMSRDIEDLDGHPTISCPWHGARIQLDDGHKAGTETPQQRVHKVRLTKAGRVEVTLNCSESPCPSDHMYVDRSAPVATPAGIQIQVT